MNRRYHFVLLSDHGQSQGRDLPAEVREVARGRRRRARRLPGHRRRHVLDRGLGAGQRVPHRPHPADRRGREPRPAQPGRRSQDGDVGLGPGDREGRVPRRRGARQRPELVVVGSGNLGLVWFAREPGRLTLEDLEELHPGLVGALANHPGVGWVLVHSAAHGPVVVGAKGLRQLVDGTRRGGRPAGPVRGDRRAGPVAAGRVRQRGRPVRRQRLRPHRQRGVRVRGAGRAATAGLGGWQTRAMLVHPADWPLTEAEHLHGAPALHRQLVRWLEDLGHRTELPEQVSRPLRPTVA